MYFTSSLVMFADELAKSSHFVVVLRLFKELSLSLLPHGERNIIFSLHTSWSRIHERTSSLRCLCIILRVLILEVSVYNVYCTLTTLLFRCQRRDRKSNFRPIWSLCARQYLDQFVLWLEKKRKKGVKNIYLSCQLNRALLLIQMACSLSYTFQLRYVDNVTIRCDELWVNPHCKS